jgi:hypothetical protein
LNRRDQIAVGQIGERMAAVQTADVLEENEMLTMGAVEGFHISPCESRAAKGS